MEKQGENPTTNKPSQMASSNHQEETKEPTPVAADKQDQSQGLPKSHERHGLKPSSDTDPQRRQEVPILTAGKQENVEVNEADETPVKGQDEQQQQGEDLFSLKEFLQGQIKEDTVKHQLASNKYVQRKCRFDDGYIYQPVFSCQTCYEEMLRQKGHDPVKLFAEVKAKDGKDDDDGAARQAAIAELVEPHGFCVACMLHCHEGHEVHELYSKLDFRCDCGNGRTPMACQIDGSMQEPPTFEGKPHYNAENVYNQTFYDIYCVCKKPHSAELIDNYMVQCFNCEDWFHNQHLLPPMLTKQLEDEYILICRACLPKMTHMRQILPYSDLMEPACRKAFAMCYKDELAQHQQTSKRQKLSSESEQSHAAQRSCLRSTSANFGVDQPALDLIISDQFLEVVCPCDDCTKSFARVRKLLHAIDDRDEALKALETNLGGEVVEQASNVAAANCPAASEGTTALNQSTASSGLANPENGSPNSEDNSKVISDYLLSKFFENIDQQKFANMAQNMSPDAQYYVSKNLNDLRTKFAEFVNKFTQSGSPEEKVIKTEDVCQFFEEMGQVRKQNLARQISGQENNDDENDTEKGSKKQQ